jgi:MoxR-like ATPase
MTEISQRFDLEKFSKKISEIKAEAGRALIGQEKMLDLLLTAFFAGGHVLIEGVPGVAKTLSARLLAATTKSLFKRIQFTPDLMPSDILGTSIFNPKNLEFEYKPGPVFANMVLIDEINRAPSKTQAALFEVMEERQITHDGVVHPMESLFMVMATQNPIEQEGTYRLPEAQLDRFLFKIVVDYPTLEEEQRILALQNTTVGFKGLNFINPVITKEEAVNLRENLQLILAKDSLLKYIAELIHQTRNHPSIYLGASPRASIDLLNASKAYAAMRGRDFITPEDVQYLLRPVIEHRISLSPEAELQGITIGEVSQEIIQQVIVPN